jgi:iron complex outermembrane recepter protein
VEMRAYGDALVYGSVTRGFKSGGFNLTSTQPGQGYAPEWAWSYESGVKTAVAGGRARLNVAAFYTDYTDLQVQVGIRPGLIDVSNAAVATIRGLELEAVGRVGRGTQLGGHVAWLDATYDRYTATGPGGVSRDVTGNRLNNAPEWSGRFWIQWTTGIGRGESLSLRADSTWQSTVFFNPFNDDVQQQRPYGLLGVGAEYGPPHRWSVAVYGRNLTNEDFITGAFGTPAPAIGGRPAEPREVGLQFVIRR